MGTRRPEFDQTKLRESEAKHPADLEALRTIIDQWSTLEFQTKELLKRPYEILARRRREFEATPTAQTYQHTKQAIQALETNPDLLDAIIEYKGSPRKLIEARPSQRQRSLSRLREIETEQARAASRTYQKILKEPLENLRLAINQTIKITPLIFNDGELEKKFQRYCKASNIDPSLKEYNIRNQNLDNFRVDKFLEKLSKAHAAIHQFLTEQMGLDSTNIGASLPTQESFDFNEKD